jgi:hypothetical protein
MKTINVNIFGILPGGEVALSLPRLKKISTKCLLKKKNKKKVPR